MRLMCEHSKIKSGVCDLIVDTDKQSIEGFAPFWMGEKEIPLKELIRIKREWQANKITLLDVIAFLRQHDFIIHGTHEEFRELERQYPNIWDRTRKQRSK